MFPKFLVSVLSLIVLVMSACVSAGPVPPYMLQVFKPLVTNVVNKHGTPVIQMWQTTMPQKDIVGAGFPILTSAQHVTIFQATLDNGGYNHHPNLLMYNGRFYATWSNHPKGEDAPGQRVLYSTSNDGIHWQPYAQSYAPPQAIGQFTEVGYYCVASRWFVHEDQVYALGMLYEGMGWENATHTELQPTRDKTHFYKKHRFVTLLMRPLNGKELGPMVALNPEELPKAGRLKLPIVEVSKVSKKQAFALEALRKDVKQRQKIRLNFPPESVDPCRLVEPTIYTATDGKKISLMRDDRFSHRMYVSVFDEATKQWAKGFPTNIPDSPSLSKAVTLADGRVLLVGNNMAPEFDKEQPRHHGRDPLMISVSHDGYRFTSAYALRVGRQPFRVPFVRGRGGGAQYPDVKVVGDKVYVLYSVGKEDIAISVVLLSDLK